MLLLIAGAAAMAGCSEGGDNSANASATTNSTVAKPKKVPYCFFKSENSKGWAASRGKDGNIVVKGKGYLADARYKADLGTPEVDGATASVQLKMPQNDTGFARADGWWDISKTIPDSAAITKVDVLCGAKTLASLTVGK
jgi:hypothetical protein